MKEIYFAGGCFWGVEEYFSLVPGVVDAVNGYANGSVANPTYKQVCTGATGHVETVHVSYDPTIVSLKTLVEQLFAIIDPLSFNRQGNDVGSQYRTGVYYVDAADEPVIRAVFDAEQAKRDRQKELRQLMQRLQDQKEDVEQILIDFKNAFVDSQDVKLFDRKNAEENPIKA